VALDAIITPTKIYWLPVAYFWKNDLNIEFSLIKFMPKPRSHLCQYGFYAYQNPPMV
jgi:hypothetical protein